MRPGALPFKSLAEDVLELALREALSRGDDQSTPSTSCSRWLDDGEALRVLRELGRRPRSGAVVVRGAARPAVARRLVAGDRSRWTLVDVVDVGRDVARRSGINAAA